MPYEITFGIARVKPTTVNIETAAEDWAEVQGLIASDERVTIIDPHGRTIEWQELKELAAKEAN